ncbi:MAG: glutathione S-transferase [Alphaproteobacteria bacterium]|jgi:glutathione S-transferase
MMIKVWGYESSSNVQKVLWTADELGVPWELVPTGGPYRGHKDASYLAINPNGQIPTMEDDGFVLWESNAIVQYLVDVYGPGGLVPVDARRRAMARRWMDWQLATLNGPSGQVMKLTIRTPEADRDPDAVAAATESLNALWLRFEQAFGDGPFVAGDFSMGDIPVGIHAHRWFNYPIDRPDTPKICDWYARLGERPAYRQHVMGVLMPGQT